MYDNEHLSHHGILGMKWGVRRYQNYDGSYTREGMRRYKISESDYQNKKQAYKNAKKASKKTAAKAKQELKESKRKMERDYQQLAKDKAGDKGKELYRSGKTITGSAKQLRYATYLTIGGAAATHILKEYGKEDLANYAAYATIGLQAANAVWGVKNDVDAHYLRAYYAHSRNR